MRSLRLFALLALGLGACADAGETTAPAAILADAESAADHWDAAERTYRVTVTNLTTGQPLSPGVVVTHTKHVSIFEKGDRASDGIREIAENGDPSTAAAELAGARGIHDVRTTNAPVGRVGGTAFPTSLSLEIDAARSARYLSLSMMLICTNDGFAGVDGIKLPGGFREEVYYAEAYDSGTEVNDELAGSIVPPCFGIGPVTGLVGGGGRTAEQGVVRHHRGIKGIADLTSAHDWRGPVARIVVQRIR